MKNKPNMVIIICVTFLIILTLSLIAYLYVTKEYNNKKVTTTSLNDIKVDKLPSQDGEEDKIDAKPFNTSLSSILEGKELVGNYKIETYYSGAKFNFNCTKMDNDTCVSGSAIINIGTAILPLYSYDKEEDNYDNHQNDYYIMLTDSNLILTSNYAGKMPGKIKIYDLKGNKVSEVNNVITGYIINNNLEDKLYPTLNNKELNYYTCFNNQVFKTTISIDNPGVLLNNEKVPGVKCY